MKVWVLVWGGGGEPESPAITLFQSKESALDEAERCIAEWDDGDEGWAEGKLDELKEEGHAYELGDTWLTLEETEVQP